MYVQLLETGEVRLTLLHSSTLGSLRVCVLTGEPVGEDEGSDDVGD